MKLFGRRRERKGAGSAGLDGLPSGPGTGPFESGIRAFRDSARAAADRPDAFWKSQRAAIRGRLQRETPVRRPGKALLWAPAAVAVLIGLFLFTGKDREPVPDFAAGADQALLVDVELALRRYCPDALAPAEILVEEMR